MKKILLIVGPLVLLAAGGGAAFFLTQEEPAPVEGEPVAEVEEIADPVYVKLSPPLVVNFTHRGNLRYLQTTLEAMHREQDIIDKVTLNLPLIRNNLIMMLSDQTYDDFMGKTAKEELRVKINAEVSKIVPAEPPVEVFITSFVMQ
ncbi:MAG: flagellar basal body-associated FliL family protein [Halieaceae bacterium]|nr:flagellar basal body-associated FliL family protein [Halieaceae bacterium]